MRVRGLKHDSSSSHSTCLSSHPMRVRGLKQSQKSVKTGGETVAPHAGAWIETSVVMYMMRSAESHPMRVRGLKRIHETAVRVRIVSHPMRVRGLKPCA